MGSVWGLLASGLGSGILGGMAIAHALNPDLGVVFTFGWGRLAWVEVEDHRARLLAHSRFRGAFRQLLDLTQVSEILWSTEDVCTPPQSQVLGAQSARAVVAPAPLQDGLARLLQTCSQHQTFRLFHGVDEALTFLGLNMQDYQEARRRAGTPPLPAPAAVKALPVTLRPAEPRDLEVFFAHQLDPEANWLAAFVGKDPMDRAAFDAHWARILKTPGITNLTILEGTAVAGHIACFPQDGELELTYWLGRDFWGRGVATQALQALLRRIPQRPLRARVASGNPASLRVLQKSGFQVIGTDRGYANGRGQEIEEYILNLAACDQAKP